MKSLATLFVMLLVMAIPAQATTVQVEITGTVEYNQVTVGSFADVVPGDSFSWSFTVDSDNYLNSTTYNTRGYVIDIDSFTSIIGPATHGFKDPFPGIPYFVLRESDPVADGFFMARDNVDWPYPDCPLDEVGVIGDFAPHFEVGYEGTTLASLDILDAVGTYDYTGLTSFYTVVLDDWAEPMGLEFGELTITEVPEVHFWQTGDGNGLMEGISNNGVAVGSFAHSAGEYFMWTADSGVTTIGGVPAGSGVGGQAKVSNDGLFLCGSTYNAVEDYHEMSRYDVAAGTWTGFGMIPGIGQQIDAEVSSGWGISGDGLSVVGLGWTTLGTADTHAFQWTEGVGPIDLGSASVGNSARANGVDLDGDVVVGWQDGAGRQGSVWVDGVQELIFKDTGDPAEEAYAVSDDGVYATGIGYGGFFDPGYAYRYNTVTDTYEQLPNLAVGAESRMAGAGITEDGSTIVGGTWPLGPATFGKAIIWREGIGTIRLDEYLDEMGITYPDGYNFAFASDISPDGRWITGWGGTGFGASESFVIHLPEVTFTPAMICFETELALPQAAAFQVDITNVTADPITVSGGVYVTLCNGNEYGPIRTGVLNVAGFDTGHIMWSQPIHALGTTCDCDLVFTVKAQDDAVGYMMTDTCTVSTICAE